MPTQKPKTNHHRQAIEFEKTNLGYLQFVSSTNNFKKLYDHSAIIFKADIAPIIGYKTVNFNRSGSKNYAEYGSISFKNFDNLLKKLSEIGLEPDKNLSTENIIYIKLLKNYTEQEILKIYKKLENEQNEFNKIIIPANPMPTFFVNLINIEKSSYENFKKIHPFARDAFATKSISYIKNSLDLYLLFANGKISSEKFYKQTRQNLLLFKNDMVTFGNLELIPITKLEKILSLILTIEKELR